MKRLRVPSSTNFTNDRVRNPRISAASTAPFRRAFNSAADPPFTAQQVNSEVNPRGNFMVSDAAERNRLENVENFLDKCFHCQERLNQGKEVYMYGDFKAFCTSECRAKQIYIDSKMEKASNSNQAGGSSGSRYGKNAALQFQI